MKLTISRAMVEPGTWCSKEQNMKYVIFGVTGFLGERLAEFLLKKGLHVVGVARNEGKLVALKEQFPKLEIITGDIADKWIVKKAMKDAYGVFLLSGYKHVGLAEQDVFQCVHTNVTGVVNVLEESMETLPEFVVFTSTDKAAQIAGVYGSTKKIGEKLFEEAEGMNQKTKYRVVRYGNVWASTSSFITKWIPKMRKGEEIILTDSEATRFFWKRDDAINLILQCLAESKDALPWVPEMKSMRMGDIVTACHEIFGDFPVKEIGLQKGENKHETMGVVDNNGKLVYSNDCEFYTIEEIKNKFVIDVMP